MAKGASLIARAVQGAGGSSVEGKDETYYKVKINGARFPAWPQEILDKCIWCDCFKSNRTRIRPISKSLAQDIAEGLFFGPVPSDVFETLQGVRAFSWVCRNGNETWIDRDPVLCDDFCPLGEGSPRLVRLMTIAAGG